MRRPLARKKVKTNKMKVIKRKVKVIKKKVKVREFCYYKDGFGHILTALLSD